MPPRYYAAEGHGEQVNILSRATDHDAAMAFHVKEVERGSALVSPDWQRTVLLDLNSIDFENTRELIHLLHTDPALKAIYELGRQHEVNMAYARASAEMENPS